MNGVYKTGSSQLLNLWRSGTSSAWITFRSLNKWGAKLSGNNQSTTAGVYFGTGANYIRFQDFELSEFSEVAFSLRGSNILLLGNLIHDIGRICTDSAIGRDGYYSSGGTNITLDRNIIHDIGRHAPGENGCYPTNAYYQNHDHGLYINGTNNLKVFNNLFYNIGKGWPIHVYPGAVSGLAIYNNTFMGANPWRDGHIYIYGNVSNSVIQGNVMYGPRRQAVSYGSGTIRNLTIQSNKVFPGVITADSWPSGVTFNSNSNNSNPGSFLPENWTP